ncbi:MAG: hypothetical protein SWY16_00790 [Cyanobacteriota bacterium]|nr:hypothetical protein [Cyanobacteriota bacterium]
MAGEAWGEGDKEECAYLAFFSPIFLTSLTSLISPSSIPHLLTRLLANR